MIHAYHESICLGLQFKVGGKFHLSKCGVHIAHRIGGYDVKVIEEGRTA
jgi:hypothetical protein